MKIPPQEAARIAALARLQLPEDKLALFAGQFEDILGYMDQLGEVDTTGVEPMYSPAEHATVFRGDAAEKRVRRDDVLANAPETDGTFFVVPKIV
ncbi:MAG: Asp-tRNA(Asn)/Glu-tRNA(Gln) amidotransferase subunit GatC [Desulfovibrionaceae bacterium]|jgi:aspartyl-tRNA(Asn)/glutamyl-tRNA(Gln) amidotransferase subunit C|nr:Asp-tRNA(Asn)/Glu-tRNA(Gln) amidotransferase subunit GatC [Desulfovibrionaceae bacterium]